MYDMNTLLRDGLDKIKNRVTKTIAHLRHGRELRDELREAVRDHAAAIRVEEWQVWYMLSDKPEHRQLVRKTVSDALQGRRNRVGTGRIVESDLIGKLRAFERYLFGPTVDKATWGNYVNAGSKAK